MKSFFENLYAGTIAFICVVSGGITIVFILGIFFGDFSSFKSLSISAGVFLFSGILVMKNKEAREWFVAHLWPLP